MQPQFSHLAIIGLGLIGGSVAKGMRQRGLIDRITAYDLNAESLAHALSEGIIDEASASVHEAAAQADVILVGVPVLAMRSVFEALAPAVIGTEKIVTDVGSVKCPVLEAATAVLGEQARHFVAGHPIAGSERHGVTAADGDLFANHKVILTPESSTRADATARVRWMWESLNADVVEMESGHHDLILAQTSHLPHLLAYALVDTLSAQGDSLEVFQYAAGGFRDFSRIAASDPVMWRDIFATNKGPVLEILDRYIKDLGRLRGMIEDGQSEDLVEVFRRAKAARDHFSALLAERNKDDR